jgi:hypothetical protein
VNRAAFDDHLQQASPCRDVGTPDVPTGLPARQYVYDLGHDVRTVTAGVPDAGAFEWAPAAPGTGASAITIGRRSVRSNGSLLLTVNVSGPGAVTATATIPAATAMATSVATKNARSVTYGRATARANAAGKAVLTLKPTAAGKKALRKSKRLTLALTITFKPARGGAPVTRTAKAEMKLKKARTRAR